MDDGTGKGQKSRKKEDGVVVASLSRHGSPPARLQSWKSRKFSKHFGKIVMFTQLNRNAFQHVLVLGPSDVFSSPAASNHAVLFNAIFFHLAGFIQPGCILF